MSLAIERTLPLAWKNRGLRFYLREIFFHFYIHFFPLGNRQTVGKKTEDHTKGEVRLMSGVRAHAPCCWRAGQAVFSSWLVALEVRLLGSELSPPTR